MVVINDMKFSPVEGCSYEFDYELLAKKIEEGLYKPYDVWHQVIKEDLFFIVYFILKIPIANHPFVVRACKEVQENKAKSTLDVWARGHFKSSILTIARPIQKVLNNPEERIAIFSYSQRAAQKFTRNIKEVLQGSELLRHSFPDVLYMDPRVEATKWSEESGLTVKRKSHTKEASIEAFGLLDSMPTGSHFTGRVYDDVSTPELAGNPDMMEKLNERFDLSQNLGTFGDDDWESVIGTPYHHEDLLNYLEKKVDPLTSKPIYFLRKKPATVGGEWNGASVFLSEKNLAAARTNRRTFSSQQLLNPSPSEEASLRYEFIKEVEPHDIPKNLYKFITIDPAGSDSGKKRHDCWAICCFGVAPFRNDIGASDYYILDFVIDNFGVEEATRAVVDMVVRNGRVLKIGVEKVGISTAEIHIANALRAKGKSYDVKNGRIVVMRPGKVGKAFRIEQSLVWPLSQGKFHMSRAVSVVCRERLKLEMQKFPYWHDDALDTLSYGVELVKGYRFGPMVDLEGEGSVFDKYMRKSKQEKTNSWMVM